MKKMAEQILVALKSEDRLNQMIPYIEKNAQPGMEVIFLIRFAPNGTSVTSQDESLNLKPLEDIRYSAMLEETECAEEKIKQTSSLDEQRLATERKTVLALDAMRKRGIEIAVDVYSGSLKNIVNSYTRKGNVRLLIKRARVTLRMMQYLRRTFPILGLFNHPATSPMRLLHASH